MTATAVVIEDKDTMRALIAKVLGGVFATRSAPTGEEGLRLVREDPPDVVVSDIRLPGIDGLGVLEAARAACPDVEVILVTGFGEVAQAVQALKAGAFHYLTKPFDPDELLVVAERALAHKRLREQARSLTAEVGERYGLGSLVGRSPAMRRVYALVEKLRDRSVPVLVTGESGTGKELVARALHYTGVRRDRRFVAVNCGAIPGTLLESELFGHAKGAFTGAAHAKPGLVEEADGGTLFLDEIGELPLDLQVKLNRFLEDGVTRRLGETRETRPDARVVAATHRDLAELARAGRFREDLFYRLNVVNVALPPLRDRREDVPALVAYFLARIRDRDGTTPRRVGPDALDALMRHDWPGNARELRSVVERAAILAEADAIGAADLPPELGGHPAAGLEAAAGLGTYEEALATARDDASRRYLAELMRAHRGRVSRAAEHAGLQRESLHRLLRRYGIDPDVYRA